MADTHSCIICKKNKVGRFTRPASGIGGAWTKKSLPAWYCYTCLEKGKGRGEGNDNAHVTVTSEVVGVVKAPIMVSPKAILSDKTEGMAKLTPIQTDAQQVPALLRTKEDYDAADLVLGSVKKARKWWKLKMYGTPTQPGPIPTIKSGLDMLYALNNELDHPLKAIEDSLKGKMVAYIARERAEAAALEAERLEAQRVAAEELERAMALAEAAKTPKQIAKAAEQVEEAETEYVQTLHSPLDDRPQSDNSSVRVPKKPKVMDVLKFCRGIADGEIPVECIDIKQGLLNSLYRESTELVLPGVELVDDIQIVGRS